MPAHTKGDYGIEGFTRSGLVFQCYCPDEEYDTKTLYKNQRKKITEDLGKLKKYKRELQRYFGPTKIKQWVFLTPKFTNKELVAHCQNKASEYRGMADAMDILDNNFDVLVKDEQFFLREILIVKQILKQKLPIDVDVREDEIIDWRNCNAEYVTTLFNKINVLFNDDEKYDFKRTNKYVDVMVRYFVRGQKVIKILNNTYPLSHEKQLKIKNQIQKNLTGDQLRAEASHYSPGDFLESTLKKYKNALIGEGFETIFEFGVVDDLVNEAIADWLARCPLDFGGI